MISRRCIHAVKQVTGGEHARASRRGSRSAGQSRSADVGPSPLAASQPVARRALAQLRVRACWLTCLVLVAPALAQTLPGTGAPGDPFEVFGRLYSGQADLGFTLGDGWAQGASRLGVLDVNGNPARDALGRPFRAARLLDENWGNEGDGFDSTVFAGNNKNNDWIGADQSPWSWEGGGSGGPQKNDVTNAYIHTRIDPLTGDRWVFVGAETRSTSGDSHVDFEFNQAGIAVVGQTSGKLVGLGPAGGRTVGDLLISVDFTQGGRAPVASARIWDGSAYQLAPIPADTYSATNLADIAHGALGAWKHFTSDGAESDVLLQRQLVEAGVNLTALGIGYDVCAPDATFTAKTRSSSSFTADLKDFVLLRFPLQPPPRAEITAPQTLCPGATFEASAVELTGLSDTTFAWEIAGCGAILSDPSAPTITVQADADCVCDITLTVAVTGGECDSSVVAQKTVAIRDNVAPTLEGVPADEIAPCDAIPQPPAVTAVGHCSPATVEMSENTTPGDCRGEWTIKRTWTATDGCGNQASQTQTIAVVDTVAPVLAGVPVDATVECDAIPAPAQVSATDNCSDAFVQLNERIESGACDGSFVVVRTWTATDECDNQTVGIQRITVRDTTAPVLSGVPADETVECESIPQPPAVTASDNCSDAMVALHESVNTGDCADGFTITRTWTATDACGNQSSQSQVLTVRDTTAPLLAGVPADETVECDAVPDPAPVAATDNCSDPLVELNESVAPGDCPGRFTIRRTWTATDACGNQSSHTQVIRVQDTTDPVLAGVPADETVECDAIPQPATVTATDNCTAASVELAETVTPGDCQGRFTITRTWTANDECGNRASQSQVITVIDTQPPVLSGVPADATVECDAIPQPAQVTATDNCSDSRVDFDERVQPGACAGQSQIVRTWTATDDCGNQTTQSQTIQVVDTTAPVLSGVPADQTVECDSVPQPARVTARDNCSSAAVIFRESTQPGACAGQYVVTRTWTATDACGNQVERSQTITVQDTTPPVIRASDDGALFICDGPAELMLEASDNCSGILASTLDVQADHPERVVVEDLGAGVYRITLLGEVELTLRATATDGCNNTSAEQMFSVTAQCGDQACSPGFWRNHLERWRPTGFNPGDLFLTAFQITNLSSPEIPANFNRSITLLQALNSGGGSFGQTLFLGTAALLNAAHPEVDAPSSLETVRRIMQDAFAGRITFEQARSLFAGDIAAEGECGCPFSGGRPTTYDCQQDVCPGDVTGNGRVDLSDLSIVLRNFGKSGGVGQADGDFDGDGDVDLTDFAVLLSYYGVTCPG